jgi:hypothetical protein
MGYGPWAIGFGREVASSARWLGYECDVYVLCDEVAHEIVHMAFEAADSV